MAADSSVLPQALYKASIGVLFNDECAARVAGISGAAIYKHHICLYDRSELTGSCNASVITQITNLLTIP